MYKVLIITYYFPPSNGVAGWRPYSWYKHFPTNQIDTTIITRHWVGNETTWNDSIRENFQEMEIEENAHSRIIRLPHQHSFLKKLTSLSWAKIKVLRKLFFLLIKLLGKFSIEVDATTSFKKSVSNYLEKNTVHAIIVSAPPHNLVQLGYQLAKKYNLPLIIDFRDLWDNDELKKNYKPTLNKKIDNVISKFYLKKWLKDASLITTVSAPLADKIRALTKNQVIEITNGFEAELFKSSIQPSTDFFTISIIGTINPQQDISIILNGLKAFITQTGKTKIKINFIGIEAIKSVSDHIKKELLSQDIFTSERLYREKAIEYTLKSHVLLYAGWKNYKGIYSGKIFDYLGAKRNILIAPGDQDVIDHIVTTTNAGRIANSCEEFVDILLEWYAEWKKSGRVTYYGIESYINSYTRENQAEILARHLLTIIKLSIKE